MLQEYEKSKYIVSNLKLDFMVECTKNQPEML